MGPMIARLQKGSKRQYLLHYVCSSVRQCAAVCGSVQQCAAVCGSVRLCAAVCSSVQQCAAVCGTGSGLILNGRASSVALSSQSERFTVIQGVHKSVIAALTAALLLCYCCATAVLLLCYCWRKSAVLLLCYHTAISTILLLFLVFFP